MKRLFYLLSAILLITNIAKASPGDTTWVQANADTLSYYGSYDTTITFPAPGTTYRKIYMIFTMGKYMCPSGSTYCGDWDYTVQNYLMTPGGDTLELGRLITPYANAGAPRTPWAWQQHYVYDVTDYASVLHGSATMRIFFSGYSGGFLGNIKFMFIEGTPERNVLAIKRLWNGSYSYGGTPDINTHFPTLTETSSAGTNKTALKFTVTGHGADNNGCCEFMSHNYQVMLNNTSINTTTMWRSDCGSAELYPQSGTWLFERANWCPGALVNSFMHTLTGISAVTTYSVAIKFDAYTSPGGSLGSYTTEATLFDYGPRNKILDASMDQIIAPTTDENHYRENPVVDNPVVHVRNTGSTTITAMQIACTVDAGTPFNYSWSGTLAAEQETDITITGMTGINAIAGSNDTVKHAFKAEIMTVNGSTDDDLTNNSMITPFIVAPRWPMSFKILFKPNNEAVSTGSTISETTWKIYDASNTVVASRTGCTINTAYADTLHLIPGSYSLVIEDGSCDGLQWWYHASAGDGVNAGYLIVRQVAGANIAMHGYNYTGTYNNDFGCGFTQRFIVANTTGTVNTVAEGLAALDVYPNPAQGIVNVDVTGIDQVSGKIQVIDMLGRVVSETVVTDAHSQVNTGALPNGPYNLLFIDAKHSDNRLTGRLLIMK